MKGYKAFDKDLQCRDMRYDMSGLPCEIGGIQYEIGGTYESGDSVIGVDALGVTHRIQGFSFCKSIADCYHFYRFYDRSNEPRICEVEAFGDMATDNGIEYYTNKIHIIREVENQRVKSELDDAVHTDMPWRTGYNRD